MQILHPLLQKTSQPVDMWLVSWKLSIEGPLHGFNSRRIPSWSLYCER